MPDRPSTRRIQEFYDTASPLYQKLWGGHIHHGYFRTGRESKEQATEGLIKFLAEKSSLKSGAKVLDVGCGSGILSIAAAKLGASGVVGLEIDPVGVRVARSNVRHKKAHWRYARGFLFYQYDRFCWVKVHVRKLPKSIHFMALSFHHLLLYN